jgi:ubiquinone/menaquinone biosynthesis C-methylase UbiE
MFKKAKEFNKRASSDKFKPREVIASLGIKPGDVIADIGAGGGFYSMEFSKKTGETGKVYALDTEKDFIDFINNQAKDHNITNLHPVLIKPDDLGLADASVDLMFLRNVYHHLPEPVKYFARIKKYLKPHGRVAVIEYNKPQSFLFRLLRRGQHFTPEADIVHALTVCGFMISKKFDFLPAQSFVIFRKE